MSVVGAGLAGLAAAAALGDAGFEVDVYEMRPYPGGRATSYRVPFGDGSETSLDNCQHILLRCCGNLLDFYRRLGVSAKVDFHREFYWVEPGGRVSVFRAGRLGAPAHFTESFGILHFLSWREKVEVGLATLAILREKRPAAQLDGISMADWLSEQGQSARAVERYWRQVLVSAVNEELDRMSAYHGLQVFRLAFLATRDAYHMGIPSVGLGDLYRSEFWLKWPNVRFHWRARVSLVEGGRLVLESGDARRFESCVVALPSESVSRVLPQFPMPSIEHSPIVGVHLWFDRCVLELPHATLLERNIQWVFNKGAGRHLSLLVSAAAPLIKRSRQELIDLCVRELGEFFPEVRTAVLVRAHVVKEVRATISARPGLASLRPGPCTSDPGVFVAGDWTSTGWPSTMEGAVRSGYAAADEVCRSAGMRTRFLLPDIGTEADVQPSKA